MVRAAARLEQLVRRGDAACLALWAEACGDPEILHPADGDQLSLTHLQRAALLLAGGNLAAAEAELRAVPASLPPGLLVCREEMQTALRTAALGDPTALRGTGGGSPLSELLVPPNRDAESCAPAVSLAAWLTRIQAWREVLGV